MRHSRNTSNRRPTSAAAREVLNQFRHDQHKLLGFSVKKRYLKEYRAWGSMLTRCYNPKAQNYYNYGAKGVTVCDEWRDSFLTFICDMGRAPTTAHSLDRKDRTLPYGPTNCRWATAVEQARNQSQNTLLSVFGETKCMSEWAEDPRCVVTYFSLQKRILMGWNPERAITQPRRNYSRRSQVVA